MLVSIMTNIHRECEGGIIYTTHTFYSGIEEMKAVDYGGIPFLALLYSSKKTRSLIKLENIIEIFSEDETLELQGKENE